MPLGTQNLHSKSNTSENISILLVSPHPDDLSCLRNILHHRDWDINQCAGARDASAHIANAPHSIVITECELPDGSWKDVLAAADSQQKPPLVLVVSRHADESLWGEVLNLGGYDVLLKPFDKSEVTRVIGMAWRCWFAPFRPSLNAPLAPQFA